MVQTRPQQSPLLYTTTPHQSRNRLNSQQVVLPLPPPPRLTAALEHGVSLWLVLVRKTSSSIQSILDHVQIGPPRV